MDEKGMRSVAAAGSTRGTGTAALRAAGLRGLLLVLLLVTMLALASCLPGQDENNDSATRIEVRDGSNNLLTTQSTFDFGSHNYAGRVTETFTINNLGPGVLVLVGSVDIGGTDPSWFAVTKEPNSTVQPKESTTFDALFPTMDCLVVTPCIQRDATVTLVSNDLEGSSFTFAITGLVTS